MIKIIKIMTEAIWRRRGEIATPPARNGKEESNVALVIWTGTLT